MICFSLKEYATQFSSLNITAWGAVLPYYRPSWINDFINEFNCWSVGFDYNWLLARTDKWDLQPSGQVLARLLSIAIISNSKDNKLRYSPENIEAYPITLKEYFWYLFKYETGINQ